jgi:two-component system phosphate regulon sensor histidine kinase PhoR
VTPLPRKSSPWQAENQIIVVILALAMGWGIFSSVQQGAFWATLACILGTFLFAWVFLPLIHPPIVLLSAERAQLKATLDNMVEGVALVNAQGRIEAINPVMEQLFGIAKSSASGRSLEDILKRQEIVALVSEALSERQAKQREITLELPEPRTFEAHVNPVLDGSVMRGVVLVLHDITRMRRLEDVRKEFVSNVSHELRTPLASIKGFSETLRRGGIEDEENRMEFVETIERHADRLARLVDELLELGAFETGKRTLHREQIVLPDIVDGVYADLKPIAHRCEVSLQQDVAVGLEVFADRSALLQVLRNFVENGIKYNRKGGTVTVRAELENKEVHISVQDSGMGIPKKDLPRVFERFYRVDKARSRDMGGTGLGLAIVKHIIESHGGKVWAESVEGEGATFHFTCGTGSPPAVT